MYCFINEEIIFEQYTVMNGEPVYFVQEGCNMTVIMILLISVSKIWGLS